MSKKVVLITGASSGIGEATALRLHNKGFIVYAGARRIERMSHLEKHGIHVLKLDVTDEESMAEAVNRIIAEEGTIHMLINNAGYGSYGALEDVPLAEGKYQFEVNVFGLARLTQLVLPYMRQNRYGKIVNVSSIGGKIYEPMGSWYHATKFAVEGMSDCLRLEVKDFGIDVIVIEPGVIKTEWGAIAREKVLRISGNTAYRDLAERNAKIIAAAEQMASEPEGVAKTIEKAILAARPKARYTAGLGSTTLIFFRRVLCDSLLDKVLTYMFNKAAR